MTEQEWLAHDDPLPMLEFVAGRTSDRKLRLFLCACCARILEGAPRTGNIRAAARQMGSMQTLWGALRTLIGPRLGWPIRGNGASKNADESSSWRPRFNAALLQL